MAVEFDASDATTGLIDVQRMVMVDTYIEVKYMMGANSKVHWAPAFAVIPADNTDNDDYKNLRLFVNGTLECLGETAVTQEIKEAPTGRYIAYLLFKVPTNRLDGKIVT